MPRQYITNHQGARRRSGRRGGRDPRVTSTPEEAVREFSPEVIEVARRRIAGIFGCSKGIIEPRDRHPRAKTKAAVLCSIQRAFNSVDELDRGGNRALVRRVYHDLIREGVIIFDQSRAYMDAGFIEDQGFASRRLRQAS